MAEPFDPADPAWPDLGDEIRACGYTTTAIRDLLGLTEPVEAMLGNTGRVSLLHLKRLARHDTAAAVLGRLFLLAGHVPATDLDLLPKSLAPLLHRLALVEPVADAPEACRATVAITEYGGKLFVSDPLFENRSRSFVFADMSDRCMPPHASSMELWAALASRKGAAFLDVGCGSGCQSILVADRFGRLDGFDPLPRAAMFARCNAAVNRVRADYTVAGHEEFVSDVVYDHIAFNTPNSDVGFDFVATGLDRLLAPDGLAQVWMQCEVAASDGDVRGAVARRTREVYGFEVTVSARADSPFALSPDDLRARTLPVGTLLVSHPSERDAFFDDLAARDVVEVASVVLDVVRA